MHDDVYLIVAENWVKASKPREIIQDKRVKETPDLTIKKKKYKMDLIPPALIVARYFSDEQAQIDTLQTALETITQALDEYIEEHTAEDGLLADATTDTGNVTATSVKARLREIQGDAESREERETLMSCLRLIEDQSKKSKAVKREQEVLDKQVLARYDTLTETEIKQLVIDDKWFASIQAAITGEVQRLTQALTERVKELEERYAQPLPSLEGEVDDFSMKVNEHLSKMGVDWE
jgi:type I restriction enzyme M protein